MPPLAAEPADEVDHSPPQRSDGTPPWTCYGTCLSEACAQFEHVADSEVYPAELSAARSNWAKEVALAERPSIRMLESARDATEDAVTTEDTTTAVRESVLPQMSNRTNSGSGSRQSAIDRAKKCITFADENLLRGSGAFQLLRMGGRIFKHSEGSEATFELSAPVAQLKAFISHNWSTRRGEKFMCLAMYYNLGAACAVTVLAACSMTALTYLGLLPTMEFNAVGSAGVACTLVGPWVFLLTLFTFHEVCACLGLSGPVVFLDKTCIHQTDKSLMQEGILHLAAFMQHSESMVVVYSRTYLTKLWTVYELASMLVLHPNGRLIVLPVVLPRMLVLGLLLVAFLGNFFRVGEAKCTVGPVLKDSVLVGAILLVPVSYVALILFRRMAAEHQDIMRKVADFRIQSATCYLEEDRKVVEGNIVAFIQCLGLASEGDSTEHVLNLFNGLVRDRVPCALQNSLGRLGLRYRTVSTMSCVFLLRPFDTVNAYLHGERPISMIVGEVVGSWTLALATIPLAVAGMLYIAADRPAQRLGCNAFTALLFSKHAAFMILVFGSWYVCNVSITQARKHKVWIAICAIIVVVLTAVAAYVYLRPSRQHVPKNSIPRLSERLRDRREVDRDAAQQADGHAAGPCIVWV